MVGAFGLICSSLFLVSLPSGVELGRMVGLMV